MHVTSPLTRGSSLVVSWNCTCAMLGQWWACWASRTSQSLALINLQSVGRTQMNAPKSSNKIMPQTSAKWREISNHFRAGGKSLWRETGDRLQGWVSCRLTPSAENCCADPVLIHLKNKRTSLGHTVSGKANTGGSNWWFTRSKTSKPGNREDLCLLIIIQ